MGFYGKEPFDEASADYVWMGLGSPGVYSVRVEGHAPNFTSGIQLVRDGNFVGGLKVDVMGWTGPRGEGSTPYAVHHVFPGEFRPTILVSGANGDRVIRVREVPQEEADAHFRQTALAPA